MFDLIEKLIEATATDVVRKQRSIKYLFPDFDAKTRGVEDKGGIRLVDQDVDTWKFKLHSGTKDDVWYDGYIHFKNVKPTIEALVWDRRLWVADKSRVDLRKLSKEFMDKVDVQLLCSCPADLYWGSHYIRSLGKYDAKYTNREPRSPRIRNPKQYGCLCKHLDRLLKALPFYGSTAAKWLRDFYGNDIEKWEGETKEKYGWVKPAAKALAKKKEEEKPKVEEPEKEEVPVETKESKVLTEVEVSVKVLPEPQQILFDEIGTSDELEKSTWSGEEEWRKFWLLFDGSIVPVKHSHGDTVDKTSTSWSKVFDSGAFAGHVYGKELGGNTEKDLTEEQIKSLIDIYYKYQPESLYIDVKQNYIISKIKNADHLEALLRYGKVFVVEGVKRIIFEQLLEKCINVVDEKKIDSYIEDFLYKWQEEGSLPNSFVDAIEEYWKNWPKYWSQGRLTFLRNLKKRIPDYTDEIEDIEQEIENV